MKREGLDTISSRYVSAFESKTGAQILQASKSAYYAWKKRTSRPRLQRTERIRQHFAQVFEESNQIYGSYKIAHELEESPELETACCNTVGKAMSELQLKSKVSKRFKPTTTF